MPSLIICELCEHGVLSHAGGGCEVYRCGCVATKEHLIEELTARAKLEIATERAAPQ